MYILRAFTGIILLLGIALLFSAKRKNIDWTLVAKGVGLQILIAILVLKVPFVNSGLMYLGKAFVRVMSFAADGAEFLFGGLAKNSYEYENAGHSLGVIFAFQVLPIIIFFSTITSALYYWGVLQKIVKAFAWVVTKIIKVSGAESLAATGNVFIGQAEAPLLIKPYLPKMTKSQMNLVMTVGMATIAGSVMVAYVNMLGGTSKESQAIFATHLLTASIMNVPAAIVLSKILLPESKENKLSHTIEIKDDRKDYGYNLIDALSRGASEGVKLAVNVGGMLLAFIALIALLNYLLLKLGDVTSLNEQITSSTDGTFNGLSMEYLLGQLFRPVAWSIGVEWNETLQVGSLLGQKTVFNEFIAYAELAELKSTAALSPRSIYISTFALCGFANFSSIAIQIGGIGILAPSQKENLSRLGFRALLGAVLACLMTATVAGALL